MNRTSAFAVVAAVVVAGVGVVGIAAGAPASAPGAGTDVATGTADGVALQSPLAGLNDLLQRIDALLETVLDLVRTISQLFGAGEGGEAGD